MAVANGLARSSRKQVSFVATKTTTVRNEDDRDETITAGQTFIHDPGHFLIRTYPELFDRVGGSPVRQAPRRRSTPTTPKPERTPRPTWKPFVRLDVRSDPTFTVRLEREAYLSMTAQGFHQRGKIETGGPLFGIPAGKGDDAVKVKRAGEPGPRTRSTHGSMRVDVGHIRAEAIDLERRGTLARWVGHWHTHPTIKSGVPSDHDLSFLAWNCRELHWMGRSMDHFIGLILSPNWTRGYGEEARACWARPTVHAWHMHPVSDDQFICTRANVERLNDER